MSFVVKIYLPPRSEKHCRRSTGGKSHTVRGVAKGGPRWAEAIPIFGIRKSACSSKGLSQLFLTVSWDPRA